MIIPDIGINKLVEVGFLTAGLTIGPSSVDLTISESFSWSKTEKDTIILGESNPHRQVQEDEFDLEANHFVLVNTQESVRVPLDMAAYVMGRSSILGLGLQIQNVGFIDAGFHGQITLELGNQSGYSILLKKVVPICQIVFVQMSQSAEKPYSGKYGGQIVATASRLELDLEFS